MGSSILFFFFLRALQQASQPSQPTNHTTQQASRELPKKSYLHQGEGEGYKVGFRPTFKKALVLVQHNTSIPEPHALGRCLKGKSVLEDKRLPMVRAWKSRTAGLACCRTACPQVPVPVQVQVRAVHALRCVAAASSAGNKKANHSSRSSSSSNNGCHVRVTSCALFDFALLLYF